MTTSATASSGVNHGLVEQTGGGVAQQRYVGWAYSEMNGAGILA